MINTLDTHELLFGKDSANLHRLTIQATLVPVAGDLFQPAGFPDIGHVLYDAPRPILEKDKEGKFVQAKDEVGQPKWTKEKVCILDSAASMANHLEAVSLASVQTLDLHPDLSGMPYVECLTDRGWPSVTESGLHRLVLTSLSEAHRLASTYFLDGFLPNEAGGIHKEKKKVKKKKKLDGKDAELELEEDVISNRRFGDVLREEFGMPDLGKKTHPLPDDWWNVFKTIFRYDPNSLVHGILFPALGIKLARVLTAHHEAFGAERVGASGVKFDKLMQTDSKQSIFAVDKETAREIRATFVIDMALIRSFGRSKVENEAEKDIQGLSRKQKKCLLELALWKIGRLLSGPYRFRSGCDLKLGKLQRVENGQAVELSLAALQREIAGAIREAGFTDPRVTKVYWPADGLFKSGKDAEEDTVAEEEAEENE